MDNLSSTVLENLLKSLPGMIYRCKYDNSWSMIYVNDRSTDLTGYLPEEFLNHSITLKEIIYPADREWLSESAARNLKAKANLNNEYRIQTKDGEIKWVKEIANGVYDADDNLLFIEGYITDITKAKDQEQLKKVKDFYESIINNINMDIAVFDMENRYRLISKSAIQDDELREWMIGRNDFDYCIKRNKDMSLAEYRTARHKTINESGKPAEWIEQINDAEGNIHYFVRIIKPFTDNAGIQYKVGYGMDITRLKNIENELIQREQLLSFSHSLAKIGYWVVDFRTENVEWSKGIYEILGVTGKASLRLFYNMVHPDDIALLKETNQRSRKFYEPFQIEYRIKTPDGTIKYIREQSPGKVSDKYRFSVLQDITDVRVSENALALSEKHFKAIAENSPILIAEIDSKNHFTYLNRGIDNIPATEFLDHSLSDWVAPDQHFLLNSHIDFVRQNQKASDLEIQLKVNGYKTWYHLIIGPLTGSGEEGALLLLAQDITEKKTHEHDREKLIKEINNRYNELMQFSYIVSHNLRAPIANMLGIAYLYHDEKDEKEKNLLFDYMVESAESIDQLIKDLNDVLAVRSPLNEKIETLSLSEIITEILNNLKKQISDSGTSFKINIPREADELKSIKSYLQSIILNLVSNSIKYRSETHPSEVNISSFKTDNAFIITVADNGIGLNMKTHGAQIFGLYKRFHNHIEGKGLGLHMTKMQIESLGGTISVDSEPGKGSIFTITFPLKKCRGDIPA